MRKATYITLTIIIAILPTLFVFLVNGTYDPNWFFRGNLWGERSYFFTNGYEEKQRMFIARNSNAPVTCLLLGSSRFLTVRTDYAPIENCMNFSVSSGHFLDMIRIGKFVLSHVDTISTVIVGLDDWHFEEGRSDSCSKTNLEKPSTAALPAPKPLEFVSQYLNAKTNYFAWRIARHHNVWIGFDRGYQPLMRPNAYESGQRASSLREGAEKLSNPAKVVSKKYGAECKSQISELLELFPKGQKIAVHTPVMGARALDKLLSGELENYLQIVWDSAQLFDLAYDPMLAFDYKQIDGQSWDGSHFFPEFWQQFFTLNSKSDLKTLSLNDYKVRFQARVESFRSEVQRPIGSK